MNLIQASDHINLRDQCLSPALIAMFWRKQRLTAKALYSSSGYTTLGRLLRVHGIQNFVFENITANGSKSIKLCMVIASCKDYLNWLMTSVALWFNAWLWLLNKDEQIDLSAFDRFIRLKAFIRSSPIDVHVTIWFFLFAVPLRIAINIGRLPLLVTPRYIENIVSIIYLDREAKHCTTLSLQ